MRELVGLRWLGAFLVSASLLGGCACGSSTLEDAGRDTREFESGVVSVDGGPTDTPPPTCTPATPPTGGFHVATDGAATGDGSRERPWDLATALLPHPAIGPGDTVWLHGGTYAGVFVSRLEGTEAEPVVLRSHPGEWAVLDGAGQPDSTLQIYRGDAVYRDFEITNTSADRTVSRPSAIWTEGSRIHLVDLVIHDTGNVPMYEEAGELEVYGCIIFNVGYADAARGHGHNLYVQNDVGLKHIEENIVFNGFSFGIHAYAEAGSQLRGMRFIGNVLFGNGSAAPGNVGDNTLKDNILIGGTDEAADDIVLEENYAYSLGPGERNVRFGYSASNGSIALRNNVLFGLFWFDAPWSSIELTGNTIVGDVMGIDAAAYPTNTYAAPSAPTVDVRPSRWEAGRGHVVVVNWPLSGSVTADLSSVLAMGAEYEIRDGADYLGPAVSSGTYDGMPVTLSLAPRPAASPIGAPLDPSEELGSAFRVFVVRTLDCSP